MNIDVTKIEGYESMTPEEKVAALEGFEYDVPEPDYTGYIAKKRFDEVASELAEWKRKYKAQLSEDEQKQLAHDEELSLLRQEVEANRKEREIAEIKSNYIAMGYDDELANEIASATIEGDNKRIFQIHKTFLEAHDKRFEATLLSKTPRPDGAGVSTPKTPITKDEIMSEKDPQKRQMLIAQNRELF